MMDLNGPLPIPLIAQRIEWRGDCNRCGLCCVVQHEGRRLVCEHLRARVQFRHNGFGGPRVPILGEPEASWCGVYEQRVDGMPIRMLDGHGRPVLLARCGLNSALEDAVILERGIGRGCSLEPVRETVPVNAFIRGGP